MNEFLAIVVVLAVIGAVVWQLKRKRSTKEPPRSAPMHGSGGGDKPGPRQN